MQIVSDIGRCRKLKESGFPQKNTIAYYVGEILQYEPGWYHKDFFTAAPTVEEMVEWLAENSKYEGFSFEINEEGFLFEIYDTDYKGFQADTLSNAMADMVLWVLEKEKV